MPNAAKRVRRARLLPIWLRLLHDAFEIAKQATGTLPVLHFVLAPHKIPVG
jgi:hypothetical protein